MGADPGAFCTTGCSSTDLCSEPSNGLPVVCVFESGGQCYQTCTGDESCPTGFRCVTHEGQAICSPG